MVVIRVMKHSESGNSAFCKVSKSVGPFTSEVGVGYLYLTKGEKLPDVDTVLPYSGEVEFTPLVDTTTGVVRTTKEGIVLQRIVLK